jgi:hypothetical protein
MDDGKVKMSTDSWEANDKVKRPSKADAQKRVWK